jgi:hypothetical protein
MSLDDCYWGGGPGDEGGHHHLALELCAGLRCAPGSISKRCASGLAAIFPSGVTCRCGLRRAHCRCASRWMDIHAAPQAPLHTLPQRQSPPLTLQSGAPSPQPSDPAARWHVGHPRQDQNHSASDHPHGLRSRAETEEPALCFKLPAGCRVRHVMSTRDWGRTLACPAPLLTTPAGKAAPAILSTSPSPSLEYANPVMCGPHL